MERCSEAIFGLIDKIRGEESSNEHGEHPEDQDLPGVSCQERMAFHHELWNVFLVQAGSHFPTQVVILLLNKTFRIVTESGL